MTAKTEMMRLKASVGLIPRSLVYPLSPRGRASAPAALVEEAQAQGVQFDEAFGIALVVGAGVVLEGHHFFAVEALRRLAAHHIDRPLVELEAPRAADMLLAEVDGGLQPAALGRDQ